ncbi:threonine aldolase family protein [Methanomassiliicoccus luminyensis]|uniref:threonine aldolase family protein n=1 Tax=Methanomassiliicoccus luminyensis TaxID=1080712 RepID=UPI000360411B|nr:low specificity L-threonine aldolase [Methanomassiliicoccus luminyensis]
MKMIDLRSDTVTLPTPDMMQAIAEAELGDDVFREDPTINKLQELAARTFGKEAALLVTSGTQANMVSVLAHCRPGDEVILEADSHLQYYEVGGLAAVAGVTPRLIEGDRGRFTAAQVQEAARGEDIYFPNTTLLEIENTHNRAGGTCWTPSQVAEVAKAAHDLRMKVHIDGARIFNAAVALDVGVKDYARHVDSLMFSLSKGLSCPVGSVVVGDSDFIERARKKRKMLGGGMRQAGIIAAPGIVALNKMVPRLKEDHDNARRLAEYLGMFDGLKIDLSTVQTNMVLVDVADTGLTGQEFRDRAAEKGLLISVFGPHLVRFVTHYGITAADVDEAAGIIESMLPRCSGNACAIG